MQQTGADEIDLKELIISIYLFFRRHAKLVGSSMLLGILLALALFWVTPRLFTSKMVIQSDILTESITDRITETLNELIKEENLDELGKRLSLSQTEAKAIKEITIESIRGVIDANQKENEKIIFLVTAKAMDVSVIPKLQTGLMSYLENNEYAKVRVQQRKNYYSTLVATIEDELKSIDSLKKRLVSGGPNMTGSSLFILDPAKIYSESVELKEKQLEYQNELEISNSVQIIQGFTTHSKPDKISWRAYGLIGSVAGLVFSFAWLFRNWLVRTAKKS